MASNPFAKSTSQPGEGHIQLSLVQPSTPVLQDVSYQYPLKLIAPDPVRSAEEELVHTVFQLTYGGGIVAGDTISLSITLAPTTRLNLLTQGSTKVFKTPSRNKLSGQHMKATVQSGAALVYLPDPVQPFADSAFEQIQTYNLTSDDSNICVCDWVCAGRAARGEDWDFHRYVSRNEVWWAPSEGPKALLLRDNLILDREERKARSVKDRVGGMGVMGTLILRGPLFDSLARFLLDEFGKTPRIGGRRWDTGEEEAPSDEETWRRERLAREAKDGLLWTAANVRGFVLVKFGSREVEGVKTWLTNMLKYEGSIEKSFGERALLCLR